jgi:hypothetical protein
LRSRPGNFDWEAIIADYENGDRYEDLLTRYGISRRGLYLGLKRNGVVLRGRGASGARHPNWKGGRRKNKRTGYVRVWVDPSDPLAVMVPKSEKGSHVLEHRLVMARWLGRPLLSSEHVHHKNGVKHDNRLENLQLLRAHHPVGTAPYCVRCGSIDIQYQEVTIPCQT